INTSALGQGANTHRAFAAGKVFGGDKARVGGVVFRVESEAASDIRTWEAVVARHLDVAELEHNLANDEFGMMHPAFDPHGVGDATVGAGKFHRTLQRMRTDWNRQRA